MALYDGLPLDQPTKVGEMADAEVWATRTVNGGTVEVRPKTGSITAQRRTVEEAIAAAISQLDALIAAPAVATVPAGTLTTAQLSTALRTLRDSVQANRTGAQQVAAILKNAIRLVRGDFDGS